jgi:hypothetical protein
MHAINATWINGQIVPAEPVDWPEGSKLIVEPVSRAAEKIGLDESEWDDSPEAIADWVAWVDTIQPMIWAEGEEEEYERWQAKVKEYNLKAVRKQMDEMDKLEGT